MTDFSRKTIAAVGLVAHLVSGFAVGIYGCGLLGAVVSLGFDEGLEVSRQGQFAQHWIADAFLVIGVPVSVGASILLWAYLTQVLNLLSVEELRSWIQR